VHSISPGVPEVPLSFPVEQAFAGMGLPWNVFGGESGVHFSVFFPLVGIAYLLPGEVSLSLWLFYVLYRLQELVWASFGVVPGGSSSVGIDPQSFIPMQEAGGFIALSIVVIYQSRRTLAAAWQGLIGRAPQEPDPLMPLSPRWALLGTCSCSGGPYWRGCRGGPSC